jgi:hypothetical protein
MAGFKYIDRDGQRKELQPGDRITHADGHTFTVTGLAEAGVLIRGGLVLYANIWKVNGQEVTTIWR